MSSGKNNKRLLKAQEKIEFNRKLQESIKQYESKDDSEIYEESKRIIMLLHNEEDYNSVLNLEIRLDALKYVIDEKTRIKEEIIDDKGFFYPDYTDPNFNEKIIKKKEFFINRNNEYDTSISLNEHSENECSSFQLSNNQIFLKTFLSPNTPYNGILLFHGTGVGKTCSSITIAEQYREELLKFNKKVIILLNPSIKDNFKNNIFDINKYKSGRKQCAGDLYLKEFKHIKNAEELDAQINKKINSRYNFYGYREFANKVNRIENESVKGIRKELHKKYINYNLKKIFSNTVFVIDEAHNIKHTLEDKDSGEGKKGKILPPILEQIIRIADNVKLILLTATPMFDNATEIVWLLNLLLMNDKRPTIKISEIFDKSGNLTKQGANILRYKSKGYISYVRGENPVRFPARLYPDINNHPDIIKVTNFPNKNIKGEEISDSGRIKSLKIIGCPMKDLQLNTFTNLLDKDRGEGGFGSFDLNGMLTSNITYPSEKNSLDTYISKLGFNEVFEKKAGKFNIKDEKNSDFLHIDNIESYSSKIYNIMNNIKTSNGIVFIYSQFIWGGVVPLALALEYNGFKKYGVKSKNLLQTKTKNDFFDDEPSYIIISGEKGISENYDYYAKIIEKDNKDGDKVKVIIGSETAAEGLDFKYIREVHILDPWHHLNKLEQIVGRGIRNCSHIDLNLEYRNVTIYLYASILSKNPKNDNETVDLKMYRIAENKLRQMGEVEYQLKINSVDCNLNEHVNKFIGPYWEKKINIITSQNNKRQISLNDINSSKDCNFRDCNFKCDPNLSKLTQEELNYDTFNPEMVNDHIQGVIKQIKKIYKKDLIYNLSDIVKLIKTKYLDENLIYITLNKMINSKILLSDIYDRQGYLIYDGGYYIFLPKIYSNINVSINNIRKPLTLKKKKINVTKYLNHMNKLVEVKVEGKKDIKLIISKYDTIELEINNIISMAPDKKFSIANKRIIIDLLKENPEIVVDRLTIYEKEVLIKYLIENQQNLDSKERSIMRALHNNILLFKDVFYNQSKYKENDTIWGYKILDTKFVKYVSYTNKEFKKATELETAEINKSIKILYLKPSIILGYMEEKLPEKKILFKVRDKIGQGTKGTHTKTGSICGNDGMKKEKILDFLTKIIKKNNYEGKARNLLPGKQLLCLEVELHLRSYDKQNKDKMRWFYNVEETVEHSINKK